MDIDIWAARSIAKAFDKLKISYPLTEKAKEPSFTQNWLTNCEEPIAGLIREAREVNKFPLLSSIQSLNLNIMGGFMRK